MNSTRRYSLAAGLLFFLTHVTSIPALLFYGPALKDPRFIAGHAPNSTAVALFPVTRRRHEAAAIGYLGLRTLESAVIAVGVVPILAMVAIKQQAVAGGAAALVPLGAALQSLHNATFLLGPGFICGTNTFVLAWLLHRSRMVPRFISTLGMIGGPLVFASTTAQLFGWVPQFSVTPFAAAMPALAWELSLATFLIARGLRVPATGPASQCSLRPAA